MSEEKAIEILKACKDYMITHKNFIVTDEAILSLIQAIQVILNKLEEE